MPTIETKRRLTAGGMFILPLVLVKATALVVGGTGPAQVAAAPDVADPAPLQPVMLAERAWSDEQRAAVRHIAELHEKPFGPTPLYYEPRDRESAPIFEDPRFDPAPEFIVQAILSSASGDTALINGKAYHVGDVIEQTEWRIIAIDGSARSVTILDPRTDQTTTRSVQTPR
jgi:hypothetical protein